MEDAHTHILSLPEDREASFFAVYDGHGGAKVAQYAGNHLHKNIVAQTAYSKCRTSSQTLHSFNYIGSNNLNVLLFFL